MSEDFRLRVKLSDDRDARKLSELLAGGELEHELDDSFQERVAVSLDEGDDEVFVYTGTLEQAQRAAEVVARLAAEHRWHAERELKRWHPAAERWEDPGEPLPQDAGALAAEHEQLIESEREESARAGHPEWEVRVQCESHRDTVELAERLEAEGIPSVRRWRFLLVGAPDEDSARALAERLRAEAPAGSTVTAEATYDAVAETVPPNPFAIFGGLGG